MKIRRFICNAFQENCYVVSDGSHCVIIDPGFAGGELDGLYKYLEAEGLRPEAILLTHSHWDHTLGVSALVERFGIPVISAAELVQTPEGTISCLQPAKQGVQTPEGPDLWKRFQTIATPGHTPDSVCYYSEADHVLFTGDTLFAGSIGRTDLPGGDYDAEIRSIMEKLIFLPGETDIYPGHGPASTIARERMENPFLEPFNEREEIFTEEEK